jgi:hypothetical protein
MKAMDDNDALFAPVSKKNGKQLLKNLLNSNISTKRMITYPLHAVTTPYFVKNLLGTKGSL